MKRIAALLVLLASCTYFDVLIDAASDEGTVYECTLEDGRTVEFCYLDDSADELSDLTGGTCGGTDRTWPQITNALGLGCTYACPHPGPGCNAKQGCFCPQETP